MRVHIDSVDWHLDVDSILPSAVAGAKGVAVRHLKYYVSWVQYDVSQYGFYPQNQELKYDYYFL